MFNIFVVDLPNAITIPKARVFHFADDTAIVVEGLNLESSLKRVEQGLKEAEVFAANWNVKINESKTEVVKFTNKIPRSHSISWNDKRIRVRNQATYLEVRMDSKLKFESHVRRRGAVTAERMRKLCPIFRRESRLSMDVRRKIFKAVALLSNNYGEELWVEGSEKANNTVEINARKLARKIGNFPWVTRTAKIKEWFQLEGLRVRARKRRIEAVQRITSHPNAQIQSFNDKIL